MIKRASGITVSEARFQIADREARDRRMAEEMAEPMITCMICMDEFK
jgi:hypothetical protein